jgi:hypothetical protein
MFRMDETTIGSDKRNCSQILVCSLFIDALSGLFISLLKIKSHNSIILLHVRFPWRRDIGALSRNNAEYTTVAYATMYIGRFATIKTDCGYCWRVTLLRCANVSMVTRFVVYGVGLI